MLNKLIKPYVSSLVLLTDFYQLTMAYGYWKSGIHEHEAVFHHVFRKKPFQGGYAVCAGLGTLIEYLAAFKFDDDDIAYLASLLTSENKPLFESEFLTYLKNLRFSCDVDAIEEGTIIFPQAPLVRIKGPLLQCQLLESILLNIINFQTLVATRAARMCYAAKGEPIVEFGLRRAQGFDGAISASRAAYIGGCAATSNVMAGKLFGIPVRGTHAHSWIMCFPTEVEAFTTYAKALPDRCVFLVDTYNTLEGVKNAIKVAQDLKQQGFRMAGIRLDSGDLAYLSIEARKLLDAAGFQDAAIMGSNDLDEHLIANLKEQGATINTWGVGTRLATAYEQPALDGVYKLSAIRKPGEEWQYKLKLSEQSVKISTPGILQIRRYYSDHRAVADAIYDESLGIPDACIIIDPMDNTHRRKIPANISHENLLQPIFRAGKLVYKIPSIEQSRQKTLDGFSQFHESILRFLNPHVYPVGLEERLYQLKIDLVLKAKGLKE